MFSADAELASRDPALPGLAAVLDPELLGATLRAAFPSVELGRAAVEYLRYKPATSCLARCRIEVAGSNVELGVKACRRDAHEKLQKAVAHPGANGPLGPGRVVLPELALVISVFPNDAAIPALARLGTPELRRKLLRKLFPERSDLWDGTLHTLRYKPERRYVARLCAPEGQQVQLKAYARSAWNSAAGKGVVSRGRLRVARRLARSKRYRIIGREWLPGQLLSELLHTSSSAAEAGDRSLQNEGTFSALPAVQTAGTPDLLRERLRQVGATLAEVHAQSSARLQPLARHAEAASLSAVAAGIGELRPQLACRVREQVRRLAGRMLDAPPLFYPIHGDFYAHQVLLDGERIAILDFDEAALGDPAADLGNFIAHLEWDSLRGNLNSAAAASAGEALVEGYELASRRRPANIEAYTAAALLRLAPHPFRTREPDWPVMTEALVARAAGILERAPVRTPRPARSLHRLGSKLAANASVPVIDPFRVTDDPQMSFLAPALDGAEVQSQLRQCVRASLLGNGRCALHAIRVTRHKPGRRCLIEYDFHRIRSGGPPRVFTLIGKVRVKEADLQTYHLQAALWNSGFGLDSADGISVPEPIGAVPEWRMTLQKKLPGVTSTLKLTAPAGVILARRIADAAHKLHSAAVTPRRHHTIDDELRILEDRLSKVAELRPDWVHRLRRVFAACERLATGIREPQACPIHRDFYADQVLVTGARLFLLDLDLVCGGDPALDIGNFQGHLIEQALRTSGNPDAFADRVQALEQRFVELRGETARHRVRSYATLTLVRHVFLSTQFPNRHATTLPLLLLCEQRLGRSDA